MSKILASVTNLMVKYGNKTAVKQVSFEVKGGEILAMIGPNGSGKTSTVECLEGLRIPTAGTITVFGKNPLTNRKEIYRQLGVQLQDVAYPEKIKVEELCMWFSSFYHEPANYQKLLTQLGLESKKKRYVSKLSGGEKQRLSILLAMLPRPKLLILDELTTGLDPEVRRMLWESLKVIRNSGTGILLVSHYMDEVEMLADRMVFMLESKAIYTGTVADFYTFAKDTLSSDQWQDSMSLEEIYLAFAPKSEMITLEGLS